MISLEYSTGFNIILNEGLPYFFRVFNQYNDINIALTPSVVNNHLILDMVGEYLIDFNYDPSGVIQIGLGDIEKFNSEYMNGPTHNNIGTLMKSLNS